MGESLRDGGPSSPGGDEPLDGAASPPDAPPVKRVAPHFPCFDGYRAIAVVGVLLAHVTLETGATRYSPFGAFFARLDVSPPLFFLISAFLLYRPFAALRLRDEPRPATGEFFRRRGLRVLPAYWVALTVYVYIFKIGSIPDIQSFILYYGLIHIYSPTHVLGPLIQSYTLATEISFYVFLPIYAWFMRRWSGDLRHRLRTELIGVAVLYAISVVFRATLLITDAPNNGMFNTWLLAWFDVFALGMFLAIISAWLAERPAGASPLAIVRRLEQKWAPAVCWIVAGVLFWIVSTQFDLARNVIKYYRWQPMVSHLFYGCIVFLLVLPGVFGRQDQGGIRWFLRTRVVLTIGMLSYGIYLWHEAWLHYYAQWFHPVPFNSPWIPMFVFVFVAALATAAVSYVVVEKPALRLKHVRFGSRRA